MTSLRELAIGERAHCERLLWIRGEDRPCGQSRFLRRWYDTGGVEHRACPRHLAELTNRFPVGDPPMPVFLHEDPDFTDHPPEATWQAHGELGLGSPWTRDLFRGGLRDEVEALIPAGFRIDVTALAGRPGPWRVRVVSMTLTDADGRPTEVLPWTATRDPVGAVRAMAEGMR